MEIEELVEEMVEAAVTEFRPSHYIIRDGQIVDAVKVAYTNVRDWNKEIYYENFAEDLPNCQIVPIPADDSKFTILTKAFLGYIEDMESEAEFSLSADEKREALKDFWAKYWDKQLEKGEICSHEVMELMLRMHEKVDKMQF
jgi:hypothetical protein